MIYARTLLFLSLSLLACVDSGNTDETPSQGDMANTPLEPAGALPPGALLAFAGSTIPPGFLAADGRIKSAADYPALYAAVGETWGDGGDGTGPLFNLPDLRGAFVRGVDGASKRDPEAQGRAALAPGGAAGDSVGTFQDWSTGKPRKPFTMGACSGTTGPRKTMLERLDCVDSETGSFVGGDVETRPVNVSVNWVVKF